MKIDSHIRAVGFDMDGTFMNTRVDYPLLGNVIVDIMKEEGISIEDPMWERNHLMIAVPIHDWIYKAGRWDEVDRIIQEINDRTTVIEKKYYKESSPYPLAVETMDALKNKGYKVGILTRGGRDYAESVLNLWNLYDCFDSVVCRDDYAFEDAKPSPRSMEHFAKELGVSAKEILYLGDNVSDWHAARDSGASFTGVLTGGCTSKDWDEAGVVDVIDSVGELLDRI
ncbi:MAG TPA: HAD family hydrolase [Candidatus Methanomethylophilaceae archaeon]|nr:HAD family hydrolase [Candidatus Methanomethylophilaceae archaeon]